MTQIKELALQQVQNKQLIKALLVIVLFVAAYVLREPLMNLVAAVFNGLFTLCYDLSGLIDKLLFGVN